MPDPRESPEWAEWERLLEQVAKLGARYVDARAEADRLAIRPLMPEAE